MSTPAEQHAISLYVQTLAQAVRGLALPDAVAVLRGALMLAGDHDAVDPLHSIYEHLLTQDRRLELIATGQLELALGEEQPLGKDGSK